MFSIFILYIAACSVRIQPDVRVDAQVPLPAVAEATACAQGYWESHRTFTRMQAGAAEAAREGGWRKPDVPNAGAIQGEPHGDADALYAKREDLASARQAATLWADRLKRDARDFEAAWKMARAHYWLGGHAPQAERKALLEAGVQAARAAVALAPHRPEGHFWIAANMGALAESFGLRQGLKYRGDIRNELLIVLKLDPAFQDGSADRALGRWYFKVPGLFGGSKKKSEEHLRRSLTYDPNSTASRYFLAETLIDMDRDAEAHAELQQVIDAPVDPEWAPEDREFKEKARRLLATLQRSRSQSPARRTSSKHYVRRQGAA